MKKTILLFLLSLMIIPICTSCSTDTNKTITFVNFTEQSKEYKITKGGIYNFSGTLTDNKIIVKANADVTLILSGVEITNTDDEAIKIESSGTTTIKTEKETVNILSGGGDAVIKTNSNIILEGNGILNVNGSFKHGLECDGDITIKSGTININSYEHGIKSESAITIIGGNVEIIAETGKGIKAEKKFLAEDGNIKIISMENEGIESKGELTINGGNFDIVAGEDGINAGTSDSTSTDATTDGGEGTSAVPPEGAKPDRFRPEGRFPLGGEGEQTNQDADASQNTESQKEPTIPNGKMPVPPSDFIVPEGATTSGRGVPFEHERVPGGKGIHFSKGGMDRINADSVLTINGGTIKINCLGDGIDSNGTLSINGGTVIIDGPENSANGPLDSDGEMLINGATVLTASSRGMTQLPRSMTQGILNITFNNSLTQGDTVIIKDSNEKTIFEHTVERICEILLFTSPEISTEEEYTILTNGEKYSVIKASNTLPSGLSDMEKRDGSYYNPQFHGNKTSDTDTLKEAT